MKEQLDINLTHNTLRAQLSKALARSTPRGVEYLHMPEGTPAPESAHTPQSSEGSSVQNPAEKSSSDVNPEPNTEIQQLPRELAPVGQHHITHEEREATLKGETLSKETIRGKPIERLMESEPVERMEFISELPQSMQGEVSKRLEVPRPIAGGSVDEEREDSRTDFQKLLDERDEIIGPTGSYDSLGADEKIKINEKDDKIGILINEALRISRFRIPADKDPHQNYQELLQIALLKEGSLISRDPSNRGILEYYVDRADLRTANDPSLGPTRDWEWRPPVVDIFIPPEPPPKGSSSFQETLHTYTHLQNLARQPQNLSPQEQADLTLRLTDTERTLNDFINRADRERIISLVRNDLKDIYSEVKSASSSGYGAKQSLADRINLLQRATGNYKELFWQDPDTVIDELGNVDIKTLRAQYEGIGTYLVPGVERAIERELKGASPGTELGDRILEIIKAERAAERRKATADERLHYNDWRERFDFSWAENPEELKVAVYDWLEKFRLELPNEAPAKVDESIRRGRENALSALKQAENTLGIPVGSRIDEELRATIEGYVDVIGGVRLLESDGGFEASTGYLEDFSYNFNAHHDAIYLGNKKSAIIQAFLARNHGAISLGAPKDIEKPQHGDLTTFRENIEEEAKIYAATHELYIRDADFERRKTEDNDGYGWKDSIEELLLFDSRDSEIALAANDTHARMKIDVRTLVFQRIKERLDREDKDGSLTGLDENQRRNVIRERIKGKIRLAGYDQLLTDINAMPQQAQDEALWNYVRDFNKKMENQGHRLWFPSAWDTVRLSINSPTKLVDRALSEVEFDAMIEEIDDPLYQTYRGMTPEQIETQIMARADLSKRQKKELLENISFERQERETEADRAFNINRAYQKFLGIDARWGGIVFREVNEQGDTELRTISSKAEELLKAKIDLEEEEIEKKVTAHANAMMATGKSGAEIDEAKIWKRRLLRRDATFGATLALKEMGVANDLPIWNYDFFNDPKLVGTVAPYLGYRHGDKPKIADLLDQGRREMRAVYDYLADTYMDGKILVVRDEPNLELDENGQPKSHHEESWDRSRVINDAGEMAHRDIFESRFMLSTSGGVEVPSLISKIADLGIYDLLWEMGCKDFREFQGFIKRRDEVELARQSLWNTKKWKDPISYAKRLREAGAARVYLVGGQTKQGYEHGALVEPLQGAYKYRDLFLKGTTWLYSDLREIAGKQDINQEFKKKIREVLDKKDNRFKDKELFDIVDPREVDSLTEIGAGILKPLIDYLNVRRYVMNRGGRTPTNWKLDNELIVNAYLDEILKRHEPAVRDANGNIIKEEISEPLGEDHLAYAPEGRSPRAVEMFKTILKASTYHILSTQERKDLDLDRRISNAKEKIRLKKQEIEADITANGLPTELQRKMDARRNHLTTEHTSQSNIDKEIQRMRNEYIDEKVHKQVIGEWPARFQ